MSVISLTTKIVPFTFQEITFLKKASLIWFLPVPVGGKKDALRCYALAHGVREEDVS